jgi:L-glyceraldehyde 3-phosphate reductase
MGTPCVIHQPVYNMLNRWIEGDLQQVMAEEGMGCIPFSPLAQGLLTNRYFSGIPGDSRASKEHGFLKEEAITEQLRERLYHLNNIAASRGQSLAQMALAWVLRLPEVTSVLIGASSVAQIDENVAALHHLAFSQEEIQAIDRCLVG